jgi:2-polyprenyl-3-methyl-5-hydroxy-6-metoxy-1,4-benzoquinol methylase
MNVNDMARNWTRWGEKDPLWAVLTHPGKEQNRWDPAEFYATGERAVQQSMDWLASESITFQTGLALDFGCGVGRLTRALARHFQQVHGVDISTSMIHHAQETNPAPEIIRYFLNPRADLSLLNEFRYDFIYSREVLQHIPTRFQRIYLREFLRLLRPGGIAVFQTVATVGWRRWLPNPVVELYRHLKHGSREFMPMYGLPPAAVRRACTKHAANMVRSASVTHPTHASRFRCDFFCIRKTS